MNDNIEELKNTLFSREFSQYCRKEIFKFENSLKIERKTRIKQSIISLFIVIPIIYSYLYFFSSKLNSILNFFLLFIIFITAFLSILLPLCKYIDKVKQTLIPKLLSFAGDFKLIDPYDNVYRIDKYVKSLKLFDSYNSFSCSNFIVGKYKDIKIRISEISLKRECDENSICVFNGILLSFETTKKFSSDIIIKDNKEKIFEEKNRVFLEDTSFEALYDVYSDNQTEARKIITPAFMERLVKYSKKKSEKITLSFEKDRINIAIKSNKNWFTIPSFKEISNINIYRRFILDLIHILSIIETLKLDKK